MKKLLIILYLAFCSTISWGQDNAINYKAVVKNADGTVLFNQQVSLQFNILRASSSTPAYSERHTATTDDYGIVILEIGEGTALKGTYSKIDWESEDYFLQVIMDAGNGPVDMGTTKLNSVPYAHHAITAASTRTNAIVTYPDYLDRTFTQFDLISGGRIRITIEFNIQIDPSSIILGNSLQVFGSGGSATGTIQWRNGNTKLIFTSDQAFTSISPCFSGGLKVVLKGNGSSPVIDVQGQQIDGDRDGRTGGDYEVTFDIVC